MGSAPGDVTPSPPERPERPELTPEQRTRLLTLLGFAAGVAVVFFAFEPVGTAIGSGLANWYEGAIARGGSREGTALYLLVGSDLIVLGLTFAIALLGGVRVPSGMPHVFLGIFVPFMLAASQERFFDTVGSLGGLAESFGSYSFVATFAATIVLVQLGVTLARQRHEARRG